MMTGPWRHCEAWCLQARMLDGASVASINPKGPYKTLDELWDGELSDFNRQEYAKSQSK